jgi:hypothetical protein
MPIRVRRKPEWVQALLIGASTLIGAGTFWYTDIHQPAVSPATLTMTPALEMIGRRGDELLVRASLKIENRSNYRVYAPALWYTVRGYCFRPRTQPADSFEAAVSAWREGALQSRFNTGDTGDLLVVGRPSPRKESYYDPASDRRYEELFLVPRNLYAALRMEVHYMVAKDISEIDTTRWKMEKNHDVHEEIYLSRRALGYDSVARQFGTRMMSEPYRGRVHTAWRERAGAAWGWSHASLSLWPLADDARDREPATRGGICGG